MIAFDFDWFAPLNLVLILLLFLLGGLQAWLLSRSSGQVLRRKLNVKIGLNLLLWLVIAAFIFQPIFKSNVLSNQILVVGNDFPEKEIARIKDSLRVSKVFSESNFKGKYFDTLTLVGQDFSPTFFARLSQSLPTRSRINWIPYFPENQIQSISWKGILRKGQLQKITGALRLSDVQWVKVKFGNQVLDSLKLEKGQQYFNLSFPVFTERRTNVNLFLGDKNLGEIQFFAQSLPTLTFKFILDNPDFESKTLATWLANQGHAVEISTSLSKDISSKLTINKTGNPDIIITDPKNAGKAEIKKAFNAGKSILLINLTNPSTEITSINSALGTKLLIKKVSNEEALPVTGELTKLPFDFAKSNSYIHLPKYPVAIEKSAGKVAVSLLNETFPTMLNGDSLLYGNIWTSVLAAIHPAYKTNIEVLAPVYKGIHTELKFNNMAGNPGSVEIGKDTLFLNYSAINGQTADASYTPAKSSWVTLADDSEISVSDSLNFNPIYQSKLVEDFVKSRMNLQSNLLDSAHLSDPKSQPLNESRIPDWIWFLAILGSLTALWLEPKFN
ncbi:hypothetical protein L0657_07295 [Dyadobacter sp. CY345]|uniref:hypothetical protein n=1 Tax=Dyadobacter sp. CY345 TaxID=2909335 RepID=UPI001F168260|nr:hypothetical protein [Dyadobacter sp. CY345]MCF2443756.1 hypothetical protein [Dyadobacter sp. CY345]